MNFFIVSGIGWLIDLSIYSFLIFNDFDVFISNLTSAGIAVTYVYIISVNKIFSHDNSYIKVRFIIYIAYQILSIVGFTYLIYKTNIFLIGNVASQFLIAYSPLFAKIIITPFNLIVNFVFMKILLEKINIKGII